MHERFHPIHRLLQLPVVPLIAIGTINHSVQPFGAETFTTAETQTLIRPRQRERINLCTDGASVDSTVSAASAGDHRICVGASYSRLRAKMCLLARKSRKWGPYGTPSELMRSHNTHTLAPGQNSCSAYTLMKMSLWWINL